MTGIFTAAQSLNIQSFLEIWAIAFVSLSVGLLGLALFYNLLGSELELHAPRKEAAICLAISLIQAVNFFAIEVLLPESPRARLAVGLMLGVIIFQLTHLTEWRGRESVGIFLFQFLIVFICRLVFIGQLKLAAIIVLGCLGVFAMFYLIFKSVF